MEAVVRGYSRLQEILLDRGHALSPGPGSIRMGILPTLCGHRPSSADGDESFGAIAESAFSCAEVYGPAAWTVISGGSAVWALACATLYPKHGHLHELKLSLAVILLVQLSRANGCG